MRLSKLHVKRNVVLLDMQRKILYLKMMACLLTNFSLAIFTYANVFQHSPRLNSLA
jgi:hypothetical protein